MNIDDRLKDAAKRTNSSLAGATIPPLRERHPSRWLSAALAATMVVAVVGAAALLNRGSSVAPTTIPIAPGTTSTTQPTTTVTGALILPRRDAILGAVDSVLGTIAVLDVVAPADVNQWERIVVEVPGGNVVTVETQLSTGDSQVLDSGSSTWDHNTWFHTGPGTRIAGSSLEVAFGNDRYLGFVILEDGSLEHEDGPAWNTADSWVPVEAPGEVTEADLVDAAKAINDALWSVGFGAGQPTTTTTVPVAAPTTTAYISIPILSDWQNIVANPSVFGDATITGAVSLGDMIVVTGCATNDGGAGRFPVWTSTDGATWVQSAGPDTGATSIQDGRTELILDCLSDIVVTPFGLYAQGGALFQSTDARTWEVVNLPIDGARLEAIFPGTGRATVLVSQASVNETRVATLLTTTNGTDWSEGPAESAALFESSDVGDVLATGSGLLAVGASPGGEFVPTAAAWASPDGLTWRRTTGDGGGFSEAIMNAVVETESGFVAVGRSTATGQMASWTSPDGDTWHRRAGSSDEIEASVAHQSATSVTEIGDTLYAAGDDFDARRSGPQWESALWMSGDGATWERVDDTSIAIPFNIVTHGSSLIGFSPPPWWVETQQVQVLTPSD
jgi:hypothetical protein